MKRIVLKIFTLFVAATISVSLVACGNAGTSASDTTQSSSATTSDSATKSENVTLNITDMFPTSATDGNSIAFIKTLSEFKKANPNIIINEEALNPNTYETKISTLAAGNQLPDIFIFKGSMLNEFISNNLIQPVDDALNNDSAWKDGFYPGIFNDFISNGKTYGIPFQKLDTHLIFYNQKMFSDAGITSFPTTWAGFKDAITKIKAKGITPISLGNKDNWVAESCMLSTLGDRFTGVDWFNKIKAGSGAKFTDPQFVQALTAVQELSKMGAFNTDVNSIDNMQQKSNYYNGKAAMFMEGNWAISSVVHDAPKEIVDNTGIAVLPAIDGGAGNPSDNSAGAAWAYNVNTKLSDAQKAAAFKLIKAVTDSQYASTAILSSAIPASKPASVDNSKLSPLVAKYLDLSAKLNPVPIYDSQLPAGLIQVMNTGLQDLLIGNTTPKALAEKIQAAYDSAK
jgi:raffinose/stachyose/melibiose transport system substrate-binding protein